MKKKKIILLIGPSGSGKTSLGRELAKIGIPELVSHTTRAIRLKDGEVHGINYYYITKEEFDKVEKCEQTEYPPESGNFYCLSVAEVENKFKEYDTVFVTTDVHGLQQVKQRYGDIVTVVFLAVTLEEMETRMRARGDLEENIQKRLVNALKTREQDNWAYADYIIRNDVWNKAVAELKRIATM